MYLSQMNVSFKFRYSPKVPLAVRHSRPSVLYCRITVNKISATDFSTGIRMLPGHWDQDAQRVAVNAPNAVTINQKLDRIRYKIDRIYGEYDLRDEPLAAAGLRHLYLMGQQKALLLTELLDLYLADQWRRISVALIVEETYKVYSRYTNNLKAYLAVQKQTTLAAVAVDAPWIERLEGFLHETYDDGYAAKQVRYLKAALDFGTLQKWLRYNPVQAFKVKRPEPAGPLVFLLPEELNRLRTTDFHAQPQYRTIAGRLDRVRDAFLAMHELGQHYRDYVDFVRNPDKHLRHVQGVLIFAKQRQKTQQWSLVPVSAPLKALFDKYGGSEKMPTMSNTKFNDYLKTVAAAVGISKNLTTKVARKTFTDGHLNERLTDTDTTARMLGLSSTKYLGRYGQVDERRIIKSLGLGSKRDPLTEAEGNNQEPE